MKRTCWHEYKNKRKAKQNTEHKNNTVLCKYGSIRIDVITNHSLSDITVEMVLFPVESRGGGELIPIKN